MSEPIPSEPERSESASLATGEPQRADVLVIGLGSAGEALAGSLADAGLDVVGFEPSLVGGECPFLACMPSKAMLHDAHDPARRGPSPTSDGWLEAVRRRDEVAEHRDDGGHAADLEARGVVIVRGTATLVGPNEVGPEGGAGPPTTWSSPPGVGP